MKPTSDSPIEYYQPIFDDNSLLFFSPELVWTCRYKTDDENWLNFYEVDFAEVIECQCNQEIYQLKPSSQSPYGTYENYKFQVLEKGLKASLKKEGKSTMKYIEFGDDGGEKKVVELHFNLDSIISADTLYMMEQVEDKTNYEMVVTKWIKFTAK